MTRRPRTRHGSGPTPGPGGLSSLYDDLDSHSRAAQGADDLVRSADDLARRGVSTPIKIGGALAALGVVYDISEGKDPVQAVTSGGVGIFASGAVDSLFENGPDVGAASDSGKDAVTDTVGAIGDGIGAIGDGIGGLFD